MNEPLTITCCCKDERCGMTLTVLPILQYFKLTMTPRLDDANREPAVEWISPEKLQRRLGNAGCAMFGVLYVRHFLKEELGLDMQITEADRLRLLAMAKGEHGTQANQEGQGTPAQPEHAGPRPA
jgi:hypothetical protein